MGKITEYLKKDKEKFLVERFGEEGRNMTLSGGFTRMFLRLVLAAVAVFMSTLVVRLIHG